MDGVGRPTLKLAARPSRGRLGRPNLPLQNLSPDIRNHPIMQQVATMKAVVCILAFALACRASVTWGAVTDPKPVVASGNRPKDMIRCRRCIHFLRWPLLELAPFAVAAGGLPGVALGHTRGLKGLPACPAP